MNQDERFDYGEQTYDYSGYDTQGYDVQAYEEQPYSEATDAGFTYPDEPEEAPATSFAAPTGSAQARIPQAPPPRQEQEDMTAYQDETYDDDQEYLEEDEEDFPEPQKGKKAKAPKAKGQTSPVTIAVAVVGALGLTGAFVVMDPLELGLASIAEPVTSMFAGAPEEVPPEPEPVPVQEKAVSEESAEWQTPPNANEEPAAAPKRQPKKAAAEGEELAAANAGADAAPVPAEPQRPVRKPAAEPKAASKPKTVTVPKKPAAAPAVPAAQTALAFAPNSAWVAAAEVEKLWAFSSKVNGGPGTIVVEGHAGYEQDPDGLSRRRAEYVADMLRRNNAGSATAITVKAMGRTGAGPRVQVKYTSKL